MRGISFIQFAVAAMAAAAFLQSPAHAQTIFHTWVASTGSDAASCDRPTPCATFSGALAKTSAGGEITCVDSGNYGALPTNINKSVTINCEGAIGSGGFGGNSVGFIGIATAITDVVTLRGLDLDGFGVGGMGNQGLISFFGAGTLRLEKMKISNIASGFQGVQFNPTGGASLFISDSVIANNTKSGVGGGINIRPAAGVTAFLNIERSVIENNRFGIIADGTGGGSIRGLVSDSFVVGNAHNGITVSSSGTSVVLSIDNVKIAGNNFGLVASGANSGMLVGRSVIASNATGLFTSSGGVILSYRDNRLNANITTDGVFTGPVGQQ